MSRRSSRILLCVTFFLRAVSLPAQTSVGSPGQTTVKTTARAVVVDVVVDTAKGEPVPSLHQQDFQVLEDGKPQAINFFEEHKAKTLPPGALQPLPPMPPNVYTNVPPAPPSDAVNVLMLDTLNTPEQDFDFARNQLIEFLHNVVPGTRLSIVTLSDKLTFVTGFTTDASTLLAAIGDKKAGAIPETGMAQNSRGEEASINATAAMQSESIAGHGMSALGASALMSSFSAEQAFDTRNRILMTIEALQDLSKHLASVPGRKNLLWFSTDFPVHFFPNPGEQGYGNYLMLVPESLIHKTADALTAARIAVYPINAKGVMNDEALNADSRGPENTFSSSHIGAADPSANYSAEAKARASEIEQMNQLAAETGGKAIYNTNDLNTATQRAIDHGSRYYTIAYTPANNKMDGSYRHIEIQVTAKGKYKVAYRQGYNADDTTKVKAEPAADPLRPLLKFGMPSATELLYGVRAAPAVPQPPPNAKRAGKNAKLTGPTTRYNVDFMIRWQDVKLDPTPQGTKCGKLFQDCPPGLQTHTGNIQVGLQAYDRDGKAVNWAEATQGMNLDPNVYAAIQKSGIPVHAEIDLPNTDIYLETGIYDLGSGKAGTLEIPLHVGADAAAPPPSATAKTN
jgi:VWFA-related protein